MTIIDIRGRRSKYDDELFLSIDALDVEGVRKALEGGADPNASRSFILAPPLNYLFAQHSADIRQCNSMPIALPREEGAIYEIAKILIGRGADLNAIDTDGGTPLHWAATYDNASFVDLLLKNNARINAGDDRERTALHNATYAGCARTTNSLLDRGADNMKDSDGLLGLDLLKFDSRNRDGGLLRTGTGGGMLAQPTKPVATRVRTVR